MPPLTAAILKTVEYSAQFEYPLTVAELRERLVKTSASEKISDELLKNELKALKEVELIEGFIIWRKQPEWISLRRQREEWSKSKWQEVEKVKSVLRKIPWIEEVYVTGALAVNNVSKPNDDIDLCVVTQPQRLWLVRLWVIIVTSVLGKYRLHDTTGENSWCFNLWLTRESLRLNEDQRSLYTAYEIIQAKQIMGGRNGLVEENQWIKDYLHNVGDLFQSVYPPDSQERRAYAEAVARSSIRKFTVPVFTWDFLNWVAYKLQFLYMKPHLTIERVGQEYAFFHPRKIDLS